MAEVQNWMGTEREKEEQWSVFEWLLNKEGERLCQSINLTVDFIS